MGVLVDLRDRSGGDSAPVQDMPECQARTESRS
jgi:hypothetical protein